MRHILLKIISLLLLLSVHLPGLVLAQVDQDVRFKDITITTSNTHLLLFGIVQNNKQKDLEQALHNGIPMKFTFNVDLFRTRSNWPDEELVSLEFTHTLKYNPLKEIYELEIEEQKNRIYTFENLNKAMKVMNDINGLKVIKLEKLIPDNSYELRMKAVLLRKTLPMNLHYIIPFVSMWDMETEWVRIEFTY